MQGRTVLEVACGTGYGGAMLLDAGAQAVTGVDSSEEALAEARSWLRPGYELLRADARDLPFPAESFDGVTSFETVEHVDPCGALVAELRRVLRPGGIMILSTPNALHTRAVGAPQNPFHVREFTPSELRDLLGEHFRDVRLLGQRVHPRYRPCPFWERPELMSSEPRTRLRVASWKLQSRLPDAVRDRLSRLAYGRAFYPGEADFLFSEGEVDSGHSLVAVCNR